MISSNETIVSIRPISVDDTENIVRWRNSDDVRLNLYNQDMITADQHRDYLRSFVDTGKCIQFIIEVDNGTLKQDVGTIFIKGIDRHSNKGEFGMFIGETSVRGTGVAKKAINCLLSYAFGVGNFNKLYLTLFADNIPAFRAYLSTGFRFEGVMREEFCNHGQYVDILRMGITARDWKNR